MWVRVTAFVTKVEEVEEMFKVIEKAAEMRVIIAGDFNYPGVNWRELSSSDGTRGVRGLGEVSFAACVRAHKREERIGFCVFFHKGHGGEYENGRAFSKQ